MVTNTFPPPSFQMKHLVKYQQPQQVQQLVCMKYLQDCVHCII